MFRDLFARGQYGLHHLALICDDYEAERDAYVDSGAELAFEARIGDARTCWVDTSPTLGFMVELLEPSRSRARGSPPCGRRPRRGTARIRSPGSDVTDLTDAQTFPALFAAIVRQRADHPALITADETLTYAELERRSARMAKALLANGAGKGTRIALLAPDGALLLTTFYAALRIGALVTPISTLATPPELAHVVRTSDAQILVGARRFLRRDFGQNLEAALPGLADARCGSLWLSSAPHLRSVWLDDADGPRVGTTDRRPAGARRRAVTAPTTSCSPPSSGRCRPATTPSSSTPRAARRRRRRSCTTSAPSSPSRRRWRRSSS